MQAQTSKLPFHGISLLSSLPAAAFSAVPIPSHLYPLHRRKGMSQCARIWPASTMSQMSQMPHFCDTRSDTISCHSVRVSGQLAQCHRCHTFQLQKRVFSYNRCDIVTSLTSAIRRIP